MKRSVFKQLFAIALLLGLSACDGPSSDNKGSGVDNSNPHISGVVKDKDSEKLLQGVAIKVGDTKVTTDAKGRFIINVDASASQTVILTKDGYVPKKIVQKMPSNKVVVSYDLIKADITVKRPATTDIKVALPSSVASVLIPANTLRRADGKSIVGDVTLSATEISPAQNPKMMPGGYVMVGGKLMESFGALLLYLQDESGAELVLNDEQIARIKIPASSRGELENYMPVFFFDEQQDGWVRVAQAPLVTGNNGRYFDVEINRIGAWNITKPMELVEVSGCVQDSSGKPLANALVSADGINYSSITTTRTNANGNFVVPVRKNGELYVLAKSGTLLSNALKIQVGANNARLRQCLVVSSQKNSFTARLTWGKKPLDVDSHLLTPSGYHVFFYNKGTLVQAPFANLDVDDRFSYGPEVVTVRKMMVGTYEYWIDNFSETYNPGLTGSPIRVELAGATGVHVFAPPAGEVTGSTSLHLFNVVVDKHCNATVKPVNKWSEETLLFLRGSITAPEYCTPAN